jgi:hypothetical protein
MDTNRTTIPLSGYSLSKLREAHLWLIHAIEFSDVSDLELMKALAKEISKKEGSLSRNVVKSSGERGMLRKVGTTGNSNVLGNSWFN